MKLLRATIRSMLLEMAGGARQNLERDRFKDTIDYKFAQYAINEVPFHLSASDSKRAKQKYGGLDGIKGGVIYSGGRINTQKQLASLQAIQQGGTVSVSMKSYSHRKATARAFADFVMTYDAVAGGRAMNAAIRRGSSGEYGSYLITIEANEDTIVINTAKKDGVTRKVEAELIIDGTVNVIGVEIVAPLQKDSWPQYTIQQWDELKDLESTVFLGAWLDHNSIDPWQDGQLEDFLDEMTASLVGLETLLKEFQDVQLLTMASEQYYDWLNVHPLVDDLLARVELNKKKGESGITTKIDGKRVSLGKKLFAKVLQLKGTKLIALEFQEAKENLQKSLNPLEATPDSFGVLNGGGYSSWMTPFYVGEYFRALDKLSSIGILEYKHTVPLQKLQEWFEDVAKIGINEQNWKEHRAILVQLRGIRNNKWSKMMTFLQEEVDSELEIDKAIKSYLHSVYESANDYRTINKWQDNAKFLKELPDMLGHCLQALGQI
ncbi:MAG: hypothetical protein H8E97_00765 [Bacteroidetes bacterium]|nr:hypothetical protein [Bacteroidota bacterium]